MRIVLFGPPGAGKGTQAEMLVKHYGVRHISTGQIIRAAMAAGTPIGQEAKKYVNEGRLLPDDLVRQLAEKAIGESDYHAFVLDGFPRNVRQAEWLEKFLQQHEKPIQVVLSIQLPDEEIVERLSQRRIHKITGDTYHLSFKPPPAHIDPEMIVQRPDDRPDAIRERLVIYHRETAPLEEYYQGSQCIRLIDGSGTVDEVFARVQAVLREVIEKERVL